MRQIKALLESFDFQSPFLQKLHSALSITKFARIKDEGERKKKRA